MIPESPDPALGGAVLRGVERGRVRRLQGFAKGVHREPDAHNAATESFVQKVGRADLEERAEDLFRQLRLAFDWKRRALTCSVEPGVALLQTPAFTVSLSLAQDPEEARGFALTTEVGGLQRPAVVEEPAFLAVFRLLCDTVAIEFPATVDVAARIDAAEDSEVLRPLLDYPSDASWMTLKPGGPFAVQMRLEAHQVLFSIPRGGDLAGLIEGTSRILALFATAGVGLALPSS